MPDAAAVKLTGWPATIVWLFGLVVTAGALLTTNVAADEVAVPTLLVNTARYSSPDCVAVAVNEYVVDVAPEILVNEEPPLVLLCHCTVGAGVPVAMAVRLTV